MDQEELHKRLHPEDYKPKVKDKLTKHGIAIRIVVTFVILAIVFTACAIRQTPEKLSGPPQACFKHDICIDLIVVQTISELEIGLSNHSSLPEGAGMLFIFDEADVHSMWMKDMKFPIDIIWIGEKGKILHIEKDARPCVPPMCDIFEPAVAAKYVLETNSGFAADGNLFDGDKVEFLNIR